MEIHLDKRALRQIRLSAADAVEEGDTEALREDVLEANRGCPHYLPLVLRRLVPSPIDLASVRRCSA